MIWTCPNCRAPLQAQDSSLVCPSGHCFDIAREGYVNLLPASRKRSRDPGDSREMIEARRRVHREEIFRPLAEAIASRLSAACGPGAMILDLGCGEGYYTAVIQDKLADVSTYGVDIAKPAVRLAARACRQGHFAVASAYDVPLPDTSIDAVVSVFAPLSTTELNRLVKPGGHYLKVTPAPNHLWELRRLLYSDPRPHPDERGELEGFQTESEQVLEFEVELEGPLLHDLLAMTPYAYSGQRENRNKVTSLDSLKLQMAFRLALHRQC